MRLMPMLVSLSLMSVVVLGGDDALAAKKKKKAPKDLAVAVLNVEGEPSLRGKLEQGIDGFEGVTVISSDAIVIPANRASAWQPSALAKLMKRRKAAVLLRTERRPGAELADAFVVIAYGADGKPRFYEEFPPAENIDNAAARMLEVLKPALEGWSARKALRVPPPKEWPAAEAPSTPDPVEGEPKDPGEQPPVVDEPAPVAEGPEKPRTLWHLIAVSTYFDGGTWQYNLDGPDGLDQALGATFFPGVGARVDFWPLSFVGVDAHTRVSLVNFVINNAEDIKLEPGNFTTYQIDAGLFLKGRYLLELEGFGFGIGGRVGYRYWGATDEPQTIPNADNTGRVPLTVVPGFDVHALAVGAELYLPVILADRRLEIDIRAEALPLTLYSEKPDNPGESSLAFGVSAGVDVRYDLFGGFFLEVGGGATGMSVTFEGQGDRVRLSNVAGQPEAYQGGAGLNWSASFRGGLGFMY